MAEVPKRYFERFFVIGGLLFVAFLVWGAVWLQNGKKLQLMEHKLSNRFAEFIIYKDYKYLSDIKVLGPNGDFIDLMNNEGRFTVLNIWKTSCKRCATDLISLSKLSKLLPYVADWRIVAVSVDNRKDLIKVAKYVDYYKIDNIAGYYDYNLELQKKIDVSNLPMTLILDEYGRIIYKIRGAKIWHDKTIIDFLSLIENVY